MPAAISSTGLASIAAFTSQIAPCHNSMPPRTRPIQVYIRAMPATKPVTMTVW
ncbi:hypothetical protein D3C79_811390 [compost metagenome]